jgi:hypothetical protein
MTLLLTCVTPRFAVQASDRLLTLPNGDVYEEAANKATMLNKFATFAYTGLSRCSLVEPTDELLLRCLATNIPISLMLEGLAREAARGVRNLPLPGSTVQKRIARRTSFVGAGFVGMRNPAQFGRPASADRLHPFLAVISNAQSLDEEWRPLADQEFAIHIAYLDVTKNTCSMLRASLSPEILEADWNGTSDDASAGTQGPSPLPGSWREPSGQ